MITVTSRDTQATGTFIKRTITLSNGAAPLIAIPVVNGEFSAALEKVNQWELDMVAAVSKGANSKEGEDKAPPSQS